MDRQPPFSSRGVMPVWEFNGSFRSLKQKYHFIVENKHEHHRILSLRNMLYLEISFQGQLTRFCLIHTLPLTFCNQHSRIYQHEIHGSEEHLENTVNRYFGFIGVTDLQNTEKTDLGLKEFTGRGTANENGKPEREQSLLGQKHNRRDGCDRVQSCSCRHFFLILTRCQK